VAIKKILSAFMVERIFFDTLFSHSCKNCLICFTYFLRYVIIITIKTKCLKEVLQKSSVIKHSTQLSGTKLWYNYHNKNKVFERSVAKIKCNQAFNTIEWHEIVVY